MRKLPNAFAPLRAFEEQLGVLAESFAPMKALHQEIALMVEDSGCTLYPTRQIPRSGKRITATDSQTGEHFGNRSRASG